MPLTNGMAQGSAGRGIEWGRASSSIWSVPNCTNRVLGAGEKHALHHEGDAGAAERQRANLIGLLNKLRRGTPLYLTVTVIFCEITAGSNG